MSQSLMQALTGYRPVDDAEAADLARVRELVAGEHDPWSQSLPLHATASAVIVHPATRRVLLRWHARQQAWLHVGGHGDPGETAPWDVASREAAEETGLIDLAPWPDARIVHVVVVPVAAKGDAPAHEHADVRFVLATGRPEDARPEKPGAELRWVPFEEALRQVVPNLADTLARVRDRAPAGEL